MRLNPVFAELGEYPIAIIQARARDRRDAGLPVVDFAIGDPREPTPTFIAEAMKDAVPEVSQYPTAAGLGEFRSAVADYVQRRFSVTVDPATQVLPSAGAKEAIFLTPLAFVDRDGQDAVVYPTPGYPIYERGARFAGAEVIPIRVEGDFVLRAGDIDEQAWRRARIVWTNSPHNPSGAVTDLDGLGDLYETARRSDTLLLSDECYADVYEDGAYPAGPPSLLQVTGGDAVGAIVYLSLSKRSGMTGYRSGAMVGDVAAITALRALRASTGTASQEFVQAAAIAAWGDDAHAGERRKIFAEKRRILRAAFDALGLEVVGSTAGLYLWVSVGDDLAVTDRLLDEGVVVAPGRYFGAGGEGFIRLALVPTLDECEAAAETLRLVLG